MIIFTFVLVSTIFKHNAYYVCFPLRHMSSLNVDVSQTLLIRNTRIACDILADQVSIGEGNVPFTRSLKSITMLGFVWPRDLHGRPQ